MSGHRKEECVLMRLEQSPDALQYSLAHARIKKHGNILLAGKNDKNVEVYWLVRNILQHGDAELSVSTEL